MISGLLATLHPTLGTLSGMALERFGGKLLS